MQNLKNILEMGKWMMKIKPNSQTFFWLPPSHFTRVFCEHSCGYFTSFLIDPWNFHVPQYPWKFHVFPTSVTCLAWMLAQCSWYVFILNWVAILNKWPQSCFPHLRQIQVYSKLQNWEINFLTSVFQAENSWKIYQKRRISMRCNSSCTGQKIMK